MSNPFSAVKSSIKNYVVKKGLAEAKERIDTPEEREQVTKVVLDGLHLPGLPKKYAWVLSIATGLCNMLLEVFASSDTSLAVTNWKLYAHAVLLTFVSKFFLWLRQNTTNGIAVVESDIITKINDNLPKE